MDDTKKRKVYGSAYKAKIGLEAVRGVKTITKIAQEYGVHPVQVGQYKKQILARAGELFEGRRGPRRDSELSEALKSFPPQGSKSAMPHKGNAK